MKVVKIKSTERTKTHTMRFQKEDTVIPPGGEVFVSWEQACFWFGDPGLLAERRRDEYDRRRTWFGFANGFDSEESWNAQSDMKAPDGRTMVARPRLVVSDPQTGERIWMVLDDPLGNQGQTAFPVAPGLADPRDERIANLERQVQALLDAGTAVAAGPTVAVMTNQPTSEEIGLGAGFDPAADLALMGIANDPTDGDPEERIPEPDPSTAGILPDTPGQVPTGAPGRKGNGRLLGAR